MERIYCHTNLDVTDVWPNSLPTVPRIGDLIESVTLYGKGVNSYRLTLKVVRVTWKYGHQGYRPFIELGIIFDNTSIDSFHNHYKYMVRMANGDS